MLRLSKRADYALMAMKHLASARRQGAASTREIAETYAIPIELLAKVLQRLARAGLLSSQQGIHGGYLLSRPAGHISVAEVIQAIDGPLTVTACSESDDTCDQYLKCNVRDPLWRIKERIVGALADCSIAGLGDEVPVSAAAPLAFHAERAKEKTLTLTD